MSSVSLRSAGGRSKFNTSHLSEAQALLDACNVQLAKADAAGNKTICVFSIRSAVGVKYGKDSML
jgi:hypothetical protein